DYHCQVYDTNTNILF
nr:immunoglobulin light chain junction region [Macaca mulatta]